MSPQETEPDLPVSVQKSPVEAWVDRGTEYNSAGVGPFEGGDLYPTIVLPQAKQQGGNTAPPITEN